ncbi:MAG: fibro-slime domain-containing protein [Planctomycetota bacterium]|jgi:fibro-slime domain-containing protein
METHSVVKFPLVRAGLLAALGLAAADMTTAIAVQDDEDPPPTIELTGTVRDFKNKNMPDGHPDFENRPDHGWGRYSGNIASHLSEDRKPIFTGAGFKVASQWRDAESRQICHCVYDPSLGDTDGSWSDASTGGITSAETFDQWFRDVLGVNMSMTLPLTFVHQGDGTYLFDDEEDPVYSELGGFFPIDGQLFGDSNAGHNYSFTFEMHLEFDYHAADNQFFKFTGDDDVFVFIDGKLAIDLGGVHAAHDQWLDLNRLGLTDGQTYQLDFFFAERRRTHSNFRIWTNLLLRDSSQSLVSGTFD